MALAALTFCACGAVGSGAAPLPRGSPSSGPGAGFDVAVSEKTRTVTVRVGQKLAAGLHANPGMTLWSGGRSRESPVLAAIVNPAAAAVRGAPLAGFQAIAPGTAQITATAGASC